MNLRSRMTKSPGRAMLLAGLTLLLLAAPPVFAVSNGLVDRHSTHVQTQGPAGTDERDGAVNQSGTDEPDGAVNQAGTDEPDGAVNQSGTDEPDGAVNQAGANQQDRPSTGG